MEEATAFCRTVLGGLYPEGAAASALAFSHFSLRLGPLGELVGSTPGSGAAASTSDTGTRPALSVTCGEGAQSIDECQRVEVASDACSIAQRAAISCPATARRRAELGGALEVWTGRMGWAVVNGNNFDGRAAKVRRRPARAAASCALRDPRRRLMYRPLCRSRAGSWAFPLSERHSERPSWWIARGISGATWGNASGPSRCFNCAAMPPPTAAITAAVPVGRATLSCFSTVPTVSPIQIGSDRAARTHRSAPQRESSEAPRLVSCKCTAISPGGRCALTDGRSHILQVGALSARLVAKTTPLTPVVTVSGVP